MSRLVFLDTETVTLEAGPDVVWEVGAIVRDPGRPDAEWRFQLRPNMGKADPGSLEVCRFAERYELAGHQQALAWYPAETPKPARLTFGALAVSLHTLLAGRHVFGICPSYDTLRLGLFLRRQWGKTPGYADPWHYQPHDVEDEVAGYLQGLDSAVPAELLAVPRPTEELCRAVGVDPESYEKHTGLGDARLARDLHDAVTTR